MRNGEPALLAFAVGITQQEDRLGLGVAAEAHQEAPVGRDRDRLAVERDLGSRRRAAEEDAALRGVALERELGGVAGRRGGEPDCEGGNDGDRAA